MLGNVFKGENPGEWGIILPHLLTCPVPWTCKNMYIKDQHYKQLYSKRSKNLKCYKSQELLPIGLPLMSVGLPLKPTSLCEDYSRCAFHFWLKTNKQKQKQKQTNFRRGRVIPYPLASIPTSW